MLKNLPAMQETGSTPGSGKCPGEFLGQRSLTGTVHGITKSWA